MTYAESSYEGALRRLRMIEGGRMTAPAFDLAGARMRARATEPAEHDLSQAARVRDLEALASLACEENERLEAAMATLRDENASLQRRIAMLEAAIADPRTALGLAAYSPFDSDKVEVPRRATWLRAGLSVSLVGLGAAALLTIAAGFCAGDGGVQVAARLRSPVLASLEGAAAAIDDLVARGSALHPRYGRGLVPAGWAPTLPEPVIVPPPPAAAAVVLAPPVEPAPVAVKATRAVKRSHAKKPAPSVKKLATPAKKIGKRDSDPLGGLEL